MVVLVGLVPDERFGSDDLEPVGLGEDPEKPLVGPVGVVEHQRAFGLEERFGELQNSVTASAVWSAS